MDFLKVAFINLELPFTSSKKHKTIFNIINDTVCFNQGELAQYSFLAGEKHRLMKDEINSVSPAKDKVKSFKEDLESHLYGEYKRIAKENFKRIGRYFDGRAKIEPRVCIKVARNGYITDFFREEDQFYVKEYKIEDNTGFSYVNNMGTFYHTNNIPKEVKLRRYYNPRLDGHKALLYKTSKLNWLYQRLNMEDKEWIECWEENTINEKKETPFARQCYKSTLITPMTLLGNTLAGEFKKLFKIKGAPERAIYGFLCFDHHFTDYFNIEMDRSMSYIFADLLSLYLIMTLIYTEYSKTYQKAKNLLS